MQHLKKLFFVFFAACAVLLATWQPAAQAADLTTPESAIAAYIDGVARQDFKAAIAVSSAGKMGEKFNFAAQVDRVGMLMPSATPLHADGPFFVEINRAKFTAQIAQQMQFLIYGLMASDDILNGTTVRMDSAAATALASSVRGERLVGLSLVKTGIPNPTMLASERYQADVAVMIRIFGADEATERLALLSFEGQTFVLGFSLLRYGEDWTVTSQSSRLAATTTSGVPGRMSPEGFEQMLR